MGRVEQAELLFLLVQLLLMLRPFVGPMAGAEDYDPDDEVEEEEERGGREPAEHRCQHGQRRLRVLYVAVSQLL